MDKWSIIHGYRRLVRDNVAYELSCPEDNAVYAVKMDKDGEPVLHCFTCSSTVTPGLSLWGRLEAAVSSNV